MAQQGGNKEETESTWVAQTDITDAALLELVAAFEEGVAAATQAELAADEAVGGRDGRGVCAAQLSIIMREWVR